MNFEGLNKWCASWYVVYNFKHDDCVSKYPPLSLPAAPFHVITIIRSTCVAACHPQLLAIWFSLSCTGLHSCSCHILDSTLPGFRPWICASSLFVPLLDLLAFWSWELFMYQFGVGTEFLSWTMGHFLLKLKVSVLLSDFQPSEDSWVNIFSIRYYRNY